VVRRLTKEGINQKKVYAKCITTIMAKTYRRRHRRANRTRRGGGKHSEGSSPRAASAASAPPAALALAPAAASAASPRASPPAATHADLAAIFKRVNAIAAKATPPKKTISKKPTKTSAQTHFEKVLAGKATHSKGKSAFRHDSGQSDSRIGQSFVYGK
jgi:hypothetical protein